LLTRDRLTRSERGGYGGKGGAKGEYDNEMHCAQNQKKNQVKGKTELREKLMLKKIPFYNVGLPSLKLSEWN
jgi:hypothetical protein